MTRTKYDPYWDDGSNYSRFSFTIVYDDIVDDSEFKRSQFGGELDAISQAQNAASNAVKGVFDYEGKYPSEEDEVPLSTIELRSGHLDKADVDTVKRALEEQAQVSLDADEKASLKQEQESLTRARNEAIDKALGVTDGVNNPSNV